MVLPSVVDMYCIVMRPAVIASESAKFGQTGPRVGSFDTGYGAGLLHA